MINKDNYFWDKVKSNLVPTSKILDLGDNKARFKEYKHYNKFKDTSLVSIKEEYDCILVTDYLEYDPFYEISILSCRTLLASKGVLVITISFTPISEDIDYYKHLTIKEIKGFLPMDHFNDHEFQINEDNDLLFYGIQK